MKRLLLIVISFISTTYGQQSKDYCKSVNSIDNIALAESRAYSRLETSKNNTSASQNFDIKYYRCEWEVNPAIRYITGKVTSYFITTSPADYISFDLMDALIVDSVTQKNSALSFEHLDNTLKINFTSPEATGMLDSVTIYYKGVPANTGFGSFITSVHAGVPGMWTLSEPYGSRDWWPCKNGLDDKADSIDVIITNPAQYTAASNGLRESEIIDGSNKITHWKHRYPIATYLVCMGVTNYTEFVNSVPVGGTSMPMQTFCYPESLSSFQANTPLVLATLQYYNSLFGDYPFMKEKYGHVQFGWGGGQEHQTSTFIISPDEGLMSHELAHQWFGDKITCGSWQDIWLNEGFATCLANMDFEKKYPLTATRARKSEIDNITSLPGGSVWVDDTTSVSRIFDGRLSYRKGAYLLYMLRWKLGDKIFFNGIRNYFNDTTLSSGFAKTDDLKRNLEAVSGTGLKEFFDDWFYGQGYPSYNVQWTQLGNDYVKINISQTTSHPSVSFFELPVALQFKNSTQERTVIVDNKVNGETFFRNIGFIADTLIVDPDYWLITKNNTSQKVSDNINGVNVVQVFPNPVVNGFNVYLRNFTQQHGAIKIFNAQGQLLFQKNITINGSSFTEVNTPSFSRGMYFLKVEAGQEGVFVKKILKQ